MAGYSGVPEVSSGIISPSRGPLLAAKAGTDENYFFDSRSTKKRREGPVYTITEECERLFCETLKAIFLDERNNARQDSLAVGTHNRLYADPSLLKEWIEVWDHVGDIGFRGFIGENDLMRSLFVFFDSSVIGKNLKPGLMALIDCANYSAFRCSRLVICVQRTINASELDGLIRDLAWVGFGLTTLAAWTGGLQITSSRWLLLEMEI